MANNFLSPEERGKLLLELQFAYLSCPYCSKRQIAAGIKHGVVKNYCIACGAMYEFDKVKLTPAADDEELVAAVKAFKDSKLTLDKLHDQYICSGCQSIIPHDALHCPQCGDPLDDTDRMPVIQRRDANGYLHVVSNPGKRRESWKPPSTDPDTFAPREKLAEELPAPTVAPVEIEPEPAAPVKEQVAHRRPFVIRKEHIMVAGVILFFVVMAYLLWPHAAKAKLVDTQYQPVLHVGYIEVVQGHCWKDIKGDCPTDIRITHEETRNYTPDGTEVVATETYMDNDPGEITVGIAVTPYSYEETSYGPQPTPYRCTENDTYENGVLIPGQCSDDPIPTVVVKHATKEVEIKATKTAYPKDRNVYGTLTPHPETYVSYDRDETRKRDVDSFGWFSGSSVTIPTYQLNPDKKEYYYAEPTVYYQIVVEYNGSQHLLSVNSAEWASYTTQVGEVIDISTNILGGVSLP